MILLIALLCTYLWFSKFGLDRKISAFSWKVYFRQFKERYNWNVLDVIILVLVLVIGAGLRIAGYNWGDTSIFQPDECKVVNPAITMAVSHSAYQTSNFYYPAQFLSKFAAIFIYIYSEYMGVGANIAGLPETHFIYRIIIAIVGTATIFTSFLIGNYFRKHLGPIIATLVSFFPAYVSLSKQVTGDVSSFFFLSLTVLYSLRYMEDKKNFFLVLMTMGAAMATLEKWHGAIGIGYTGFIVLLNSKQVKEFICQGLYAVGAYMVWILLLCPNMIFNLKTAILDGFINIAVYDGHKGEPYYRMLLNYGKYGFQHYGGIIYIIALILGLIFILRSFTKQYMIFLMGILKISILCFLNRSFVRWGLELYFCELLLASFGIYWLICMLRKQWRIIGAIMSLIIVADFVSGSMVYVMTAIHSHNDTRLVQQQDCLMNGITPDNSVSTAYTGFVPGGWKNSIVGYVSYRKFAYYFIVKDGRLFKNSELIDYAIINYSTIYEPELVEIIEMCPVMFSYDSKYNDIFWDPLKSIDIFWNDIKLVCENIEASIEIYNGALTGRDIVVYDVREVPYLSTENDN